MSKFKGLYSAVDEAAKALTRGKGTGKEFMIEVLKKPGVKPTEIKERGLQKIEAMPKMTKEEFLKKLEENPAPKLTETGYAEDPSQVAFSEAYYKTVGHLPKDQQMKAWFAIPEKEKNRIIAKAEANSPYEEGTKYEKWSLPGGANYREILLKLPANKSKNMGRVMELEAKQRRGVLTEAEDNELMKLQIQAKNSPEYQSSHWENDPNVLAHIRVSDREGPNGEQILHVEEIQSDWHQAGRKKGYREKYEPKIKQVTGETMTVSDLIAKYGDEGKKWLDNQNAINEDLKLPFLSESSPVNVLYHDGVPHIVSDASKKPLDEMVKSNQAAVAKMQREAEMMHSHNQKDKVPDAPFKKNWHELAMKRVLNYAAEHGYDKVAITPGAEQASRYDLSKQVDAISWNPTSENRNLLTIDTGDRKITASYDPATGTFPEFESGNFGGKTLDDVVGKEMAERILSEKSGNLSGEGLSIGGEGMKGFYDKIVPDYLNTYGKKYGVQVQMEGLPVKIGDDLNFPVEASEAAGLPSHVPGETRNLHSFDITPEMRQDIMGKGLPLYQQIGIPAGGAAAGAEALQQDEQGFATGGAVTGPVGSEYDTDPDMEDGGRVIQSTAFNKGGRVHLSQNSDTMLLDLLSKS